MLALCFALFLRVAAAQDLSFNYTPAPKAGENPALIVTPQRPVKSLYAEVSYGGKSLTVNKGAVADGQAVRIEWPRDTKVTHADVFIRVTFADGAVSEQNIPVNYSFASPLKVDISRASADIKERTVTVRVSGNATQAELVAYGAHKAELGRNVVAVTTEADGTVKVPFIGEPSEVVLLDVTLKNESAFAGFTYSPWFLDIPHEDVLFPTDSAEITPDQVYKLQATLEELRDVVDKYGAIVPVKLYIAGCTDTMGDSAHNRDLSARRAYSIARWLRANGFTQPIFTWGFGEDLLAVPTGDSVDMQANRRALYMVGANPPPAGSGVPQVGWKAL
jgi:outer membrane protein OmpA-like peptidoglycan-associated protein